jgi:hypothetical protein
MTIYAPGKVTLRQTWQPMDPDAAAYITAVETADGQALEEKVKIAIDNFVLGCKADGIWSAIKASCILAGARTLAGALVPLVGTAPTNNNFVEGDYNRETGLIGDGSTKYLNSNRNNNTDPQNNFHVAAHVTTAHSAANNSAYIGVEASGSGITNLGASISTLFFRVRSSSAVNAGLGTTTGFIGLSRSNPESFDYRFGSTTSNAVISSQTPFNGDLLVFGRIVGQQYVNGRLAFYSIGEYLNLAKLDARVTDLINAIGVAIP